MNYTEFLPRTAAPADGSPKPKGILQRLWVQMVEASDVAVRHHYHAPWERTDD